MWTKLRDRIAAVDELSMATIRFRTRLEFEPPEVTEQFGVVEEYQVDELYQKQVRGRGR